MIAARKLHGKAEVRESILDSMDSLLRRYGYSKTTVEDVAQEAGIGKGSVYLHFAGKDDVALSWLDRWHEEMVKHLRLIAEQPGERLAVAEEFLVERVMVRFDRCREYSQTIEEMLAALRPALIERKHRVHSLEAEVLAQILSLGDRSLAEETKKDAEAMIIATNSLLPYSLRPSQIGERSQVQEDARRVARLLLGGFEKLQSLESR